MMNEIQIKSLRVQSRIGVGDDERELSQELQVDVRIQPAAAFAYMNDDLARTINYAAVAARVAEVCGERSRNLLETLASDIARCLVDEFHAEAVVVEIRKFILPNTDYVAVKYRLER